MPWTVTERPAARKARKHLPAEVLEGYEEWLTAVAAGGPMEGDKPLKGQPQWRHRIGGWRVLFAVDSVAQTITIANTLVRGDAYKKKGRRTRPKGVRTAAWTRSTRPIKVRSANNATINTVIFAGGGVVREGPLLAFYLPPGTTWVRKRTYRLPTGDSICFGTATAFLVR